MSHHLLNYSIKLYRLHELHKILDVSQTITLDSDISIMIYSPGQKLQSQLKSYLEEASFYDKLISQRRKSKAIRKQLSEKLSTSLRKHKNKKQKKYTKNVDNEGNFIKINPKNTYWYMNYVKYPNLECPQFKRKFKLRFRLPYQSYIHLLDKIKCHKCLVDGIIKLATDRVQIAIPFRCCC